MKQSDFITAYGARHYTLRSQFAPKQERFGDISLDEAVQVIDKMGYDLHGRKTMPDDYSLIIGDKKRDLGEISAMFREKAPKLGLRAILEFEKDFFRTIDPEQIIGEQQGGNRNALMLVRRFSMFPTEGANVWAEFALPDYARRQAVDLERQIEALFVGENKTGDKFVSFAGPLVPALDRDAVMDFLKVRLPRMRHHILNMMAEDNSPKGYLN